MSDTRRKVVLQGMTDIIFDRYPGSNDTKLEPWQKLYIHPEDQETICLPFLNIMSFLSAQNTLSAPKRLLDPRKFKAFCYAALSFVTIQPQFIPFTRNGEPIKFGKLSNGVDPSSGVYIHYSVARLEKGIPNPKERPALPLPWELSFELTLMENSELQEQQLLNIIEKGGLALGLGTFRGIFGKFKVLAWEPIKEKK